MNAATRSALRQLNRRFYDRLAAEFSATRERPWPGWERVAGKLAAPPGTTPAVLDVGCGNGRLGSFLAGRLAGSCRYVGVDGCEPLLRVAGERLAARDVRLYRLDVLEDDLDAALGGERFDLVALFGVLHHVPGRAARRALLRRLAALVAAGGLLAASVWRLDRGDRFARRIVPWEAHNRARARKGQAPLDLDRMEDGDVLLGWGGQTDPPRYCHFPSAAEIESWIDAIGLPLVDRFEADGPTGRDNLYLLFSDPGTTPTQHSRTC